MASDALLDYAVTGVTLDALDGFGDALARLRRTFDERALPVCELFGDSHSGEVVVVFRARRADAGAALVQRVRREAARLGGTLEEATPELGRFDVRVDASREGDRRVEAFRARMGLRAGSGEALLWPVDSAEALRAAVQTFAVRGAVELPTLSNLEAGATAPLAFALPGDVRLPARARVLARLAGAVPALSLALEPSEPLRAVLDPATHAARQGRKRVHHPGRAEPRFELYAPARVEGGAASWDLPAEHVADVSVNGCFVALPRPAEVGARLALRLSLPTGETAVEGTVVRRVVPGSGEGAPGVGLRFHHPVREGPLAALLAQMDARDERVLVATDNRALERVLASELARRAVDVTLVRTARLADALPPLLDSLDLAVLDLDRPTIAGMAERLTGFGLGLRMLALLDPGDDEPVPGAEVVARGTPSGALVLRIERLLGRSL